MDALCSLALPQFYFKKSTLFLLRRLAPNRQRKFTKATSGILISI
ncbi:MAG: hypothetical protein NPIRA04_22680 [Nitrospirales bacterium]|nr:MAG: hypothetical protein NPIRA04_22680 [Nitrospirales bacterium]